MIDLFGLEVALVNRSPRLESSVGSRTSVTCGRPSSPSSASAALEQSLANRLPPLAASCGGIKWRQTWKLQVTPQRRRILAHTQSGLHTSGNDCAGWPTPTKSMTTGAGTSGRDGGLNLQTAAAMAPWPTPCTPSGGRTTRDPSQMDATGRMTDGRKHSASLEHAVKFSTWPTPKVSDMKGASYERQDGDRRSELRLAAHGTTLDGSSAATEKPGQLNPAFSRWLMGYPKAWCEAAIEAWHQMPINRRKREQCD